MDRTRVTFFIIILLTLIALGIAAYYRYGGLGGLTELTARPAQVTLAPSQAGKAGASAKPTTPAQVRVAATQPSAPAAQPAEQPAEQPAPAEPVAQPTAPATQSGAAEDVAVGEQSATLQPIFGSTYKADDGLPTYICGVTPFASQYTLMQMQSGGYDVQHGFHLGILPFGLSDKMQASEEARTEMVKSGAMDCYLTSLNSVAINDPGLVTAIVGESAGADQLWAREIAQLTELKGKKIGWASEGTSEYFGLYLLQSVGLTSQDVEFAEFASEEEALAAFDGGAIDAVVGREPLIIDAEASGGRMLASTKDFRPLVDVIVTSRQAAQDKTELVEAFHRAWFSTLKAQTEGFDAAASDLARWGNNNWLQVGQDNAADDWRLLLNNIAQADLIDNGNLLANPVNIVNRLVEMRSIWQVDPERQVPSTDPASLIWGQVVQNVQSKFPQLQPAGRPINDSFSFGGVVKRTEVAQPQDPALLQQVTALPCNRFEFVPNTTKLLAESEKLLRSCALKVLVENPNLYMRVRGSSAWPGPKGAYQKDRVEATARARAQAVADFLIAQGIDQNRFVVEWTLPPEDHWETMDLSKQAQDRYVELALLVSGL